MMEEKLVRDIKVMKFFEARGTKFVAPKELLDRLYHI